jgi:hypothetical protein
MARKDKPMTQDEIKAAIGELVGMGLVVDSGERSWCEQTQRYEVLWTLTEAGRKLNCDDPTVLDRWDDLLDRLPS